MDQLQQALQHQFVNLANMSLEKRNLKTKLEDLEQRISICIDDLISLDLQLKEAHTGPNE